MVRYRRWLKALAYSPLADGPLRELADALLDLLILTLVLSPLWVPAVLLFLFAGC